MRIVHASIVPERGRGSIPLPVGSKIIGFLPARTSALADIIVEVPDEKYIGLVVYYLVYDDDKIPEEAGPYIDTTTIGPHLWHLFSEDDPASRYVDPADIKNPTHRRAIMACIEAETSGKKFFWQDVAESLNYSASRLAQIRLRYTNGK